MQWDLGEIIGLRYSPNTSIQGIPVTSPMATTIKTGGNSIVNFSVVFSDLDKAKCITKAGYVDLQFPDPKYEIKFSSSSNFAKFNGSSSMLVGIAQTVNQNNPLTTNDVMNVFVSKTATLKIDPTWMQTSGPITVTLTIKDVTSQNFLVSDFGNAEDPTFTKTWTINYLTNCPTSLIKVTTPAEGSWVTPPITATYEAKPLSPPNYEDYIVTENLSQAVAGGLFDPMLDLKSSFLNAHPNIVDELTAVQMIFPVSASAASFSINNLNQFEDQHEGFLEGQSSFLNYLTPIFKTTSLMQNKAGYQIDQNYLSCGSNIGNAMIKRRFIYAATPSANSYEISKTHTF